MMLKGPVSSNPVSVASPVIMVVVTEYFCSTGFLGSLASDPSGELDILWHDGHTLGVNSAQVGVLEKADQVGFASLL
jgi:hypothetical protein